jgi:hypothetical protein
MDVTADYEIIYSFRFQTPISELNGIWGQPDSHKIWKPLKQAAFASGALG